MVGDSISRLVSRQHMPAPEAATVIEIHDLKAHCAAHLAQFKVPEYVEFRAEPLPRNPAGKILKQLLRGDAAASAFSADTADDAVL